ncbi:G-protein coupled receptor 151-like [Protopterus annectens]|uniref:G-protein coupled receptor 151-like n=1 Tax=Protopterus annectens TaxID=7888 RepID=UPI001CFBA8D5|nr:G-protein coupled receptor 151-like [Protopterus annectens]
MQDSLIWTMNSSKVLIFAGGFQLLEGAEFTITLPVVLAFLCFIGFVGNIFLTTVLVSDFRKGKSSIVNSLVINLCAADLLLILFCVPFRAVTYSRQYWNFGRFACKTTDWFLHSCLAAKSFTLTAIGEARHKYVIKPPKFITLHHRRLVGLLAIIWVFAFLLPVPHLVFSALEEDNRGTFCVFEVPYYASNFMNVFSKIYPLLAYVLPVSVTLGCYARIFCRNQPKRNRGANPRQQSHKVTLMLMSVSLAFSVMMLPEWIAWIWARHSSPGGPQPPAVLVILAQVILFLNSTVNPCIFFAVSEEFRDGLSSLWGVLTCAHLRGKWSLRAPRTGENGAEMVTSTVQCLQDVETIASPTASQVSRDNTGKFLPDLEHFWSSRETGSKAEDNDPTPWESQDK